MWAKMVTVEFSMAHSDYCLVLKVNGKNGHAFAVKASDALAEIHTENKEHHVSPFSWIVHSLCIFLESCCSLLFIKHKDLFLLRYGEMLVICRSRIQMILCFSLTQIIETPGLHFSCQTPSAFNSNDTENPF